MVQGLAAWPGCVLPLEPQGVVQDLAACFPLSHKWGDTNGVTCQCCAARGAPAHPSTSFAPCAQTLNLCTKWHKLRRSGCTDTAPTHKAAQAAPDSMHRHCTYAQSGTGYPVRVHKHCIHALSGRAAPVRVHRQCTYAQSGTGCASQSAQTLHLCTKRQGCASRKLQEHLLRLSAKVQAPPI